MIDKIKNLNSLMLLILSVISFLLLPLIRSRAETIHDDLKYILDRGHYDEIAVSFEVKPTINIAKSPWCSDLLNIRQGKIGQGIWWNPDVKGFVVTGKENALITNLDWDNKTWHQIEIRISYDNFEVFLDGESRATAISLIDPWLKEPIEISFRGPFLLDNLQIKGDGKTLIKDDFEKAVEKGNKTAAGGLLGLNQNIIQTEKGYAARICGPVPELAGMYPKPTFIIPQYEKITLKMTGKADDPAWEKAAKFTGIIDFGSRQLANLQGYFQVMADNERIYLSFRFEKEPGVKLRAVCLGRDSSQWEDDSVEFYLMPETWSKHFVFIGNSAGFFRDELGLDAKWNGDWQYVTYVADDWWGGEASVSFASMGLAPPKEGEKWYFRAFRYKNSGERGSSALMINDFHTPSREALVEFSRSKPYLRIDQFGLTGENELGIKGTIINPGKTEAKINLKAAYALRVRDNPPGFLNPDQYQNLTPLEEKQVTIEPGMKIDLAVKQGLIEGREYALSFQVQDKEGEDLYRQTVPFKVFGGLIFKLEPYTLTTQKLLVKVTPRIAAQGTLELTLNDNGQILQKEKRELKAGESAEIVFSTANLKEGYTYQVSGVYKTETGQQIEGNIPFRMPVKPEWWVNKVGYKEGFVPKPWIPIKVKDNRAEILGRQITFGNNGLPTSIVINGEEFLAAPVKLEVAGREITGSKLKTLKTAADAAIFTATETAPDYDIQIKSTLEYDGFTRFDLTVIPKMGKLQDLILEIPIKAKFATLYQASPTAEKWLTQFDDAGFIPPEGKQMSFRPGIWVGDDWRGLQWTTETDEYWYPYDQERAIEIIRDGETIFLRFNIVLGMKTVSQSLTYSFNLQPTPVKPFNIKEYLEYAPIMSGASIDHAEFVFLTDMNRIPYDQALAGTVERPLDIYARNGVKILKLHQDWGEIHSYPGTFEPSRLEALKRLIRICHERGVKVINYIEGSFSNAAPEWADFGYEMLIKPGGTGVFRVNPPGLSYWCDSNPVYNDFFVWGIARMIREYGTDGIYIDAAIKQSTPCTYNGPRNLDRQMTGFKL